MNRLEKGSFALLTIILIISGLLSAVNYVEGKTMLVPANGGTYREAAVGQPRHINPILATANDLDEDITKLVFSGLFKYNNDLELENDLATNVEVGEDSKSYTIKVRDDVIWHDGEPFTIDDVIFTIRSIQTPQYNSPLEASFEGVQVEKLDEYTIRFTLNEPYTPFLTSLTVGIVPEHVWSEIEPQNATLTEQILKPVGTGPFKFSEISTRRKTGDITAFRLIRNDEYYKNPTYLDEIIFNFYTSHDDAIQAVKSGTADGIGFLPLQLLQESDISKVADIHQLLLPQYFALFFNQARNDALADNGVRSALALAVDRQRIIDEALSGYGEPLHLPIPPSILDYNQKLPTHTVNIEAANQNLDEAGWTIGDDGVRTKDDKRLKVKITTTDWPEYIKTAQIVKEQWEQLSIQVELEHLSSGSIQQISVQPRAYEILLFGEILPADPDPYPFWHSTQTRSPGLNLSQFKNEDVDKLLEEGRKETDPNTRSEKYLEFQQKILELSPAIILYQPQYIFASKSIRGIETTVAAIPAGRFNDIANWHINTNRVWKK